MSNVPRPRSSTAKVPCAFLSSPYASAAAVGSFNSRSTSRPASRPASFVLDFVREGRLRAALQRAKDLTAHFDRGDRLPTRDGVSVWDGAPPRHLVLIIQATTSVLRPRMSVAHPLGFFVLSAACSALFVSCLCGADPCLPADNPLRGCIASCEDNDVCTADLCRPDGTCSHRRNCAQERCWNDECLAQCDSPCTWAPCVARHAPCSFPGDGCRILEELECPATQVCSAAKTCVASPQRWVVAEAYDAGVVRVAYTRSERGDSFVSGSGALISLDVKGDSAWLLELAADGGALRWEPVRYQSLASLYYDFENHQRGETFALRDATPPVFAALRSFRGGGAARKLGFAPQRPAVGHYRVRIVTVFTDDAPESLFGSRIASSPLRCDPSVDSFRSFWPEQAKRWTKGQQSLDLEFVDEGAMRIPTLDGGVLNSDHIPEVELFLLPWLQPEARDLLLVVFATPKPAERPGRGSVSAGVAYVDLNRSTEARQIALTATHELGHLFGASDLYGATGACAFAPGPEIPGPNMYCDGSADLVRLTAREVGWLEWDGGAAAAVPRCLAGPGSSFACDENE
jgi:hypothetical protein